MLLNVKHAQVQLILVVYHVVLVVMLSYITDNVSVLVLAPLTQIIILNNVTHVKVNVLPAHYNLLIVHLVLFYQVSSYSIALVFKHVL